MGNHHAIRKWVQTELLTEMCKQFHCISVSVGCPQPKADVFMKNWNRAETSACVHAIVEPDGDVYQLLPWDSFPLYNSRTL